MQKTQQFILKSLLAGCERVGKRHTAALHKVQGTSDLKAQMHHAARVHASERVMEAIVEVCDELAAEWGEGDIG